MTLKNPRPLIAKPRFAEMRVCAVSSYVYGCGSTLVLYSLVTAAAFRPK
jgi:hypothetical protein